MLAKRWNFSNELIDCVRDHHKFPVAESLMAECLYISDHISKGITASKAPQRKEEHPEWKAKRLGFTVERASALLGDLTPFVEEAEIFLQATYV
jgi:HD-like signal output (HDOD) protein